MTRASIGSVFARCPSALGEGPYLRRVHDGDRQLGARQGRGDDGLEATGRFERDELRPECPQSVDQGFEARAVTLDRECFSARKNGNVEPIFRDVDTDDDHVHGDPSLPNRASFRAAQATVRVRWNDGRGTELSHGLRRPQGWRPPARHRNSDFIRVAR
jgi:hypothetical protein